MNFSADEKGFIPIHVTCSLSSSIVSSDFYLALALDDLQLSNLTPGDYVYITSDKKITVIAKIVQCSGLHVQNHLSYPNAIASFSLYSLFNKEILFLLPLDSSRCINVSSVYLKPLSVLTDDTLNLYNFLSKSFFISFLYNHKVVGNNCVIALDWLAIIHYFIVFFDGNYQPLSSYKLTQDSRISFVSSFSPSPLRDINEWKHYIVQDFPNMPFVVHQLLTYISASLLNDTHLSIPHGCILSGISGIGKTLLVETIFRYSSIPTFTINSASFFSNFYDCLREFRNTFFKALNSTPSLILFEHLDFLKHCNEALITKVLIHLLCQMLDYVTLHNIPLFVFATTRSLDSLPKILRSNSRFGLDVLLFPPSFDERFHLLSKFSKGVEIDNKESILKDIALRTNGYLPLDLMSLVRDFVFSPRIPFIEFSKKTHPSLLAENDLISSGIQLDSLIGIDDIIAKLRATILLPLKNMAVLNHLGIQPPRGVLISGPSGTGKTSLALAIAKESALNVISLQATDIISKVVGQAEKKLGSIFQKARFVAPCILMIDQLEMIGRKRTSTGSNDAWDRLLSFLLIELDGLESNIVNKHIIFVATSSHPELIDPALLRSGRIDLHIVLHLPDSSARSKIFSRILSKMPHSLNSEQFESLVQMTDGFSPVQIHNFIREAGMKALEVSIKTPHLTFQHFLSYNLVNKQ